MAKTVKLVMVAVGDEASSGASQNNKYYDMFELDNGNFKVEYGRIGVTKQTKEFPMSKWDSTYRDKVKKGYKDVTNLFVEDGSPVAKFSDISDTLIAQTIAKLQAYAKKEIATFYNVTADKVTEKQVKEGQGLLDYLSTFAGSNINDKDDVEKVNKGLIQLYQVIPRKMDNVKNHLLAAIDQARFDRMLAGEQALLDTMAGQVKQSVILKDAGDEKITLLDALGLEIYTIDKKEEDIIKTKLQNISPRFLQGLRIVNRRTQKRFDEYVTKATHKRTELFWHGSRNENWMSILESGLVLRPTNAVISGKMFGYGTYFADKAQKSLGYTSSRGSYWARGNSDEAYMSLYDVHLGNALHTKRRESWMGNLNLQELKKRGDYDSLFAEGGADLINNEYIVYHEDQSTIKYLVQLKG